MQRTAIILVSFFFICDQPVAQQYPFVHYTPKDGLINSRVHKAYQDSKGRMYFLTYGGLSVYDGIRFKNYTTQDGLAVSLVNDILEVGDDSLLLATNSGNYLNVLVKGKVQSLKLSSTNFPVINQFYHHENGKIYLSSDDGLFILENNAIRKLNSSLLNKGVELSYLGNITGAGNWLVLATNELNHRRNFYLYDIEKNRVCDSLSKTVYLVGKDEGNRIWASASDKLFMLDRLSLEKGKLLLTSPSGGYLQVKDYSAPNIAFGKNCIWVVHRNKDYKNLEIRRVDEGGDLLKIPLPDMAMSSIIRNAFVDKENSIWLCNDGEGVFKIVNSPLRVFENPIGKSTPVFIDDAFYSDNVTWYSTITNKLFRKSDQGLEEFNTNLEPSPEIFYNNGKKLLAHDHRNIYEGTFNLLQKSIFFQKIVSLPENDFWGKKMLIDPMGNLVTVQASGLGVWKNNKQVFHLPIEKPGIIEGLILDKNNLLWVLKRYSGIDIYKIQHENESKYLELVCHFPNEKIKGSPRCFVIDKTGLIWIGTRDDGVVCYRKEGNNLAQLHQFYTGNGLTDNFVTTLSCDSLNNIIVGTQTGLDRILSLNNNLYRIEGLSKSSNFFIKINQVWSDSKQAYALSSSGLLLQLSPTSKETTGSSPQLLLEDLRVNAQPVTPGKKEFRHQENNISFWVAAPSFIDEKQVAFSYLLEGSGNKQWSDTTSANAVINLTNLSPGKYNLKVKAFFPSTSYVPAELSYPFEIFSPWWQKLWFRIGMGTLGMAILVVIIRFYYGRKLEKEKTILEKQQAIEKERTRIATDMHDDLGAGLTRIKFITENIAENAVAVSLKPDVEKLKASSAELIEKMGEIIWAMNEKNNTLEDLFFYLRSYAVEYCNENNLNCEFLIPENIPQKIIGGQIRRNVFLVLKESLHNIVKHACAKKVKIVISANTGLHLLIADDGNGFILAEQHDGNGILSMQHRAEALNGKLHVSNLNGTIITLDIPL